MRKFSILMAAAGSMALSGCAENLTADIPPGPDMVVYIHTQPPMAAKCSVENSHSTWDISSTPEHLDVSKARGPLEISCSNPTGWVGSVKVTSTISTTGVATSLVLGGIAAGVTAATTSVNPAALVGIGLGVAGVSEGVQVLDGTAYHYPTDIVVPMVQIDPPLAPAIAHPFGDAPARAVPERTRAAAVVAVARVHHYHRPVHAYCVCHS